MTQTIEELARGISQCQRCPLHQTRNHTVPGVGDPNADIMFIGEGPGRQEDQRGEPFVGASGQRFDQILKHAGIDRPKTFISNVLKCRTPENRDPTTEETAACRPWLEAQIETVKPRIIVTMGNPATQWFQPGSKISDLRGKVRLHEDGYLLLPTFHPAAILRRPTIEDTIKQDFNLILPWLAMTAKSSPPGTPSTEAPEPDGPVPPGATTAILQRLLELITTLPRQSQDPRFQRHSLTTLAVMTRAAEKAIGEPPDNHYGRWCRHLLQLCTTAGRTAAQAIPQICRRCDAAYYPPPGTPARDNFCPDCRPDPAGNA